MCRVQSRVCECQLRNHIDTSVLYLDGLKVKYINGTEIQKSNVINF